MRVFALHWYPPPSSTDASRSAGSPQAHGVRVLHTVRRSKEKALPFGVALQHQLLYGLRH